MNNDLNAFLSKMTTISYVHMVLNQAEGGARDQRVPPGGHLRAPGRTKIICISSVTSVRANRRSYQMTQIAKLRKVGAQKQGSSADPEAVRKWGV